MIVHHYCSNYHLFPQFAQLMPSESILNLIAIICGWSIENYQCMLRKLVCTEDMSYLAIILMYWCKKTVYLGHKVNGYINISHRLITAIDSPALFDGKINLIIIHISINNLHQH